jgi:hypothetical protein
MKGYVTIFQLKTENLHSVSERYNKVLISYYEKKYNETDAVMWITERNLPTYVYCVDVQRRKMSQIAQVRVGVTQLAGSYRDLYLSKKVSMLFGKILAEFCVVLSVEVYF